MIHEHFSDKNFNSNRNLDFWKFDGDTMVFEMFRQQNWNLHENKF